MNTGRTEPRLLLDQRAPMRDGVELSADVYLPPTGDGPWPAILRRTPYDNTSANGVADAVHFAQHGYAVVAQDVRGRCDSDGEWVPFLNEGPDGYDTVEWVAAQPWCAGPVGMMGGSYNGFVQWVAARERPPHLKALASTAASGRWMQELPYNNGIFSAYWMWWLNLVGGRTLQQPMTGAVAGPDWTRIYTHVPLRDADIALGRTNTVWRTWLEHPTLDDYWRPLSLVDQFHLVDVPALHVTGWFDDDQWGELFYWHGMLDHSPAAGRQWLVCGPWDHFGTGRPQQELGGRDFTPASVLDMRALHLRFFDRWLKEEHNGQEGDPPVRTFTVGENRWRESAQWPPAGTVETSFYLHSAGAARTVTGDGALGRDRPEGDEPADSYVYDPDDPTPSVPDVAQLPFGDVAFDVRWRLRREDVLVYTSEPLGSDWKSPATPSSSFMPSPTAPTPTGTSRCTTSTPTAARRS